ncbi:MAG: 4'-phosphopantetheinyl transferase superfamily protein [Bacteroidales bacterium]|nr:4'-phosphopantetheinyl transferase superfamily protein [Bacteroidales bacterium]MDD3300107.1 4'-phosphopantetheinyl transferase superfamily protein [Bacteroidales bacterium]MDD3843512.1 4'-phosphopantetheinyl transferase superfamily protein [Bacteroidales bacterium]MDD4617880.1 4'-phosphopantetheinyl transferase superfamily protein [Bacteroidales bacterium]
MGLYFNRELENEALISVWEITESEDELLNLSSIPNEELEELALIRNAARRKEKLAVRALLNKVFDGKVYLGHHDNGRPYLQNSLIEISISHTNRFVSILTHPEESVGIDIESLNRNYSAVEKRALSLEELDYLSDRDRDLQLAIIWSAKEAVFKRMSRSDIDFSSQIIVKKFSPRESGELEVIFIDKDGDQQEFELSYEIFENHVMAWLVG